MSKNALLSKVRKFELLFFLRSKYRDIYVILVCVNTVYIISHITSDVVILSVDRLVANHM